MHSVATCLGWGGGTLHACMQHTTGKTAFTPQARIRSTSPHAVVMHTTAHPMISARAYMHAVHALQHLSLRSAFSLPSLVRYTS